MKPKASHRLAWASVVVLLLGMGSCGGDANSAALLAAALANGSYVTISQDGGPPATYRHTPNPASGGPDAYDPWAFAVYFIYSEIPIIGMTADYDSLTGWAWDFEIVTAGVVPGVYTVSSGGATFESHWPDPSRYVANSSEVLSDGMVEIISADPTENGFIVGNFEFQTVDSGSGLPGPTFSGTFHVEFLIFHLL